MKLKCIKCGLYFKDRNDPEDKGTINIQLCWNCRSVWKFVGIIMQAVPPRLNRELVIQLDNIIIRKRKKLPYE